MFERYTEKARRVIFFARYEASQFGSPYIETEHLLLGMLREDKALTNRFLRSHSSVESIRKQIDAHTTIREKVSTSVDLPLSNECKRILAYAAEEAERLNHKHIGSEHLLLGLLREEKCFAAEILKERGVKIDALREEFAKEPSESAPRTPSLQAPLTDYFQDLTQAATDGNLEPVVGRDLEVNAVIEVLAASRSRNPLLVGERGAGKRAVVEALAQRIVDGVVPQFLAEKRIMAFEPQPSGASTQERFKFGAELARTLYSLAEPSHIILMLSEMPSPMGREPVFGPLGTADILKSAITQGKIQCIAACTSAEFRESAESAGWLGDSFRAVHIRPLNEADTLAALKTRKVRLEKFHEVSFEDQALEMAAQSASRYLPDRALPGKAIQLLDAAAARVKLRQDALPEEVLEVQKRIRFIVHRMDSAVANHEFEKARFYSEEEKKERENLRALREKYKLDDAASTEVRAEDVESVIARWSEYPFQP
ncbi:MAG: Clp protease N-terminal domain-containing protein [Terracidiphilus sp.]